MNEYVTAVTLPHLAITHSDEFILHLYECQRFRGVLTSCGCHCCDVASPLSPLLFCWWVELADRSSGTAMGSSASRDNSLAGGLSLPGKTQPSKHSSLNNSSQRLVRSSGITLACFRPVLYTFALHSSIMQWVVFFTWHLGHFLGLLCLHAVQVLWERDEDVCKFNQALGEKTPRYKSWRGVKAALLSVTLLPRWDHSVTAADTPMGPTLRYKELQTISLQVWQSACAGKAARLQLTGPAGSAGLRGMGFQTRFAIYC